MTCSRCLRAVGAALAVWLMAQAPARAQHHNQHDERALQEDPRLAPGQIAPVLEGLGEVHHPVTTSSERAQLFFDQGLRLTYGFNHQEALRAFKEAARLDPDCAMAYWGWALVLGPNLNLPMHENVVGQAWEAVQKAASLKEGVSARERAYIEALEGRYSPDPKTDRALLDAQYAEDMRALHAADPFDDDAATLYAASLMNLSPWDYWTGDGQPHEETRTLLAVLRQVIDRNPRHIGALHYYIHAIEAADPDGGAAAADLLRGLAPGAGHLVHMPSHIYIQVGRYADAFDVNVDASKADEGYITQCRAQGIYPLNYYPHNVHFLAWAALMQGRSAEALAASRKVADAVPGDMHGDAWALYQTFLSMPMFTLVRFGMWEEMLAEPQPPAGLAYMTGIWHFGKAMALLNTGRADEAGAQRDEVARLAADPATDDVAIGFSGAPKLLAIARELLDGEIARRAGRQGEALAHLERAVRLEDGLPYTEPPDWYLPTRHYLAAALLDSGAAAEAETVYWQDLRKHRENGFALFGLVQALEAQERTAEDVRERLAATWSQADVTLQSSRY
jgi:tetratricopeptide (TPR) repeat protein